MTADEREIKRNRRILDHAVETGNIAKTCRHFGVPRSLFYVWRNAYQEHHEEDYAADRYMRSNPEILAHFLVLCRPGFVEWVYPWLACEPAAAMERQERRRTAPAGQVGSGRLRRWRSCWGETIPGYNGATT